MIKPLLSLSLAALLVLTAAACSGDDDDSSSSTTTEAPAETADASTTTTTEAESEEAEPSTGSSDLDVPDGATMVALVRVEGDEPSESIIASDSEGACALGTFTPDEWDVSFSILSGVEDDGNHRTLEGPEMYGLNVTVATEGGGSGSETGEVGFTFDAESLDYEFGSEDADITVDDQGDEVSFTFSGTNEDDDVPFSGEVRCTAPVRNQ